MASFIDNLRGNSVVVTGGAGFVGSHLAERLFSLGADVVVLDNLSTSRMSNLNIANVKFVNGDIRNPDLMDGLIKNSVAVFHLAEYIPETDSYGAGHVIKYSVENPLQDFDVSCFGSLVVLDKCRKYDKPIVFTSSAAVYGELKGESLTEDSPTIPSSPYGASKLCAETYMALYSRLYGLPVTVTRFCNLYGPRQRKYILYDLLMKLMKNPKRLEILGSGLEQRDFVYVEDAVSAVLLASNRPSSSDVVFNVGTGVSTSTRKLVEVLLKVLGFQPEVAFTQNSWKGDIKKLGANVEKIKSLGFEPQTSLEGGLTQTVEWFKNTFNPSWQQQ